MTLPLDGTVVVALEQAVAAPLATRHLADLGARVIKVERVGEGEFARHYDDAVGPGLSSWFVRLNRGKESIELDVKSPAGREILDRLVARADVFVQNVSRGRRAARLRPGGAARAAPPAGHVLGLGVRPRRALPRPQGL